MENSGNLDSELNTCIIQLLNDINTWELTYILKSPIDGVISFTNYWSENQNIVSGENAFVIIPENDSNFIGKALLPIERSGKVKMGQNVNIHFLNYPDNEFGFVKGIVTNISLVPTNGNYVLEISLPNGLETTFHKQLPFSQEMQAQADIITEDLCLLERFFMPIRKILSERFQ